ncbi:hypothetical protein [Stenotrophomonas maltophilia]|uniref:hypothetical protein n=1 Tax=Stenotrophomonas maltophilia TaxID=40324 RepID=UPI0021C6842E|nr:hypothetical protein [Stenotrophomonas maltophilia]MCU1064784.1 hypothetical protein [Stenotrophomonas maltophilia]
MASNKSADERTRQDHIETLDRAVEAAAEKDLRKLPPLDDIHEACESLREPGTPNPVDKVKSSGNVKEMTDPVLKELGKDCEVIRDAAKQQDANNAQNKTIGAEVSEESAHSKEGTPRVI